MLAHTASTATPTAADQHMRVMLSFTSDETEKAAAFARQLRDEGFAVTEQTITPNPNRWPGVAFFFEEDVDKAALLARELSVITGRTEHARLSDRRPYGAAGTVEVSLLDHGKPKAEKPVRSHTKAP